MAAVRERDIVDIAISTIRGQAIAIRTILVGRRGPINERRTLSYKARLLGDSDGPAKSSTGIKDIDFYVYYSSSYQTADQLDCLSLSFVGILEICNGRTQRVNIPVASEA